MEGKLREPREWLRVGWGVTELRPPWRSRTRFPARSSLHKIVTASLPKENGPLFCDIRNHPFNPRLPRRSLARRRCHPWSQKRGIGETARGRNGVTRDPRIVTNFRGLVSVNL